MHIHRARTLFRRGEIENDGRLGRENWKRGEFRVNLRFACSCFPNPSNKSEMYQSRRNFADAFAVRADQACCFVFQPGPKTPLDSSPPEVRQADSQKFGSRL